MNEGGLGGRHGIYLTTEQMRSHLLTPCPALASPCPGSLIYTTHLLERVQRTDGQPEGERRRVKDEAIPGR